MANQAKTKVLVGMSGGVDSSAAAALLLEQGYEVIGVTLKLWTTACTAHGARTCCGPEAVADARHVCHSLGIPFYFLDEGQLFQNLVIEYFAAEYRAGRTPNPCVVCNEQVKFASLLRRADLLGVEKIATGHYARLDRAPDGRVRLRRGRDLKKDQSYFLFSLRQEQLARVLFPLGDRTKEDSRATARACSLGTAEKAESMEICFVPGNDYGQFLQAAGHARTHRGDIVDLHGRKLGDHDGIEFFTIGQRKGLRVSHPTPLYVLDLDPATNRVVVGPNQALERDSLKLERCRWLAFENPPPQMEVMAKIRYNHAGSPATVIPGPGETATVKFSEVQRAVTPGQACVFYQDDLVVGGGWITRGAS